MLRLLSQRQSLSSLATQCAKTWSSTASKNQAIAPALFEHCSSLGVEARRGYATEQQVDVELPLDLFGVSGKYASALYVAAVKAKALDQVGKELEEVNSLAEGNSTFSGFLKDPSVAPDVRSSAIQKIFGEANFTPITKNFLAILAENGRLGELSNVASAFGDLLSAYRGEVKALVSAPLLLEPDEVAALKKALQKHIKPGQSLKLEQQVDKSIIGGFVIEIGDKFIDMSVRTRLKKMEQVLRESL